jgi:hypothetical protein
MVKLYFAEDVKLRRTLYSLLIVISIVIGVAYFENGGEILLSFMYSFVSFVFLRLAMESTVEHIDKNKLKKILTILYEDRDPAKFLEEIEESIDFESIEKAQITDILIHKSIANCYLGNWEKANSILDYVADKTEDENFILKLSFYRIMFKILQGKTDRISKDIEIFEALLTSKKTVKLRRSTLKSDKNKMKYLNSFDIRILECDLLSKICDGGELSKEDEAVLDKLLKLEDTALRLEMLHYYAATNKIFENEISEAKEYLMKIDVDKGNTIIQKKSKKLLATLT